MGAKKSKDTGNPFTGLDIKQFPTEREQRAAKRRERPTASVSQSASSDEADPDTALFLLAVGSARPLTKADGSRRPERRSHDEAEEPFISDKDAVPKKSVPPADIGTFQKSGLLSPETLYNDKLAQELTRSLTRRRGSRLNAEETAARPEKPEPHPTLKAPVGLFDHEAERDVFSRAMADVAPLPAKGRAVALEPAPQPVSSFEPSNPLQDLVDGKVEFSLSGTDEFMEGHVVGLDLLTVGKLQARHYSPEAHIDLHGLNSEQAFQHMVGFFRSAYYKGVRTALVVTGRGLNSPNGVPVLRFKVQQWLTQEPFRRVVLAFCTAKREDGGPGALYVLLRKYRKNSGKVRWDAMPADPDLFL